MPTNFEEVIKYLTPYWNELTDLKFNYNNPVFWAIVVLFFLILAERWSRRKSFSFCLIISSTLLLMTKIETHIQNTITSQGGFYDPLWIRLIVGVFFVCLTLLYAIVTE